MQEEMIVEVVARLRDVGEAENVARYPIALRVVAPNGEMPMTPEHAEELARQLERLAAEARREAEDARWDGRSCHGCKHLGHYSAPRGAPRGKPGEKACHRMGSEYRVPLPHAPPPEWCPRMPHHPRR